MDRLIDIDNRSVFKVFMEEYEEKETLPKPRNKKTKRPKTSKKSAKKVKVLDKPVYIDGPEMVEETPE